MRMRPTRWRRARTADPPETWATRWRIGARRCSLTTSGLGTTRDGTREVDDDVGMREELVDAIAHQRRDVWNALFDVATVRAHQPRDRDVAIEDAHVAPFPDQRLDNGDHGALAEVVGPLLEGQPHDADATLLRLEHGFDAPPDLCLVRGQDRGEEGTGDVGASGGVEQRAEV